MTTPSRVTSEELVSWSQNLPDVVLKEWKSYTNITFKGKGFAWVNHEEDRAMIKGTHAEREALLATSPDVYEPGWETQSTAWVTVHLEHADLEEVRELLEEAWRMTATKKAIAAYDARRV
ncbi:MAG TPA: MmcQ/YjbR family DNA-binding protein [Nocardioidaceae bacterium]|nr:MmcQ/YjbR family DNA-binding protein [Nocardioidaceae bacterium]